MALELDGTGVITETISNECSVVRATINNTPKEFCFSKSIFYVFGVKCDGNLANILENGMEVNISYTFSNNKTSISAVWLGDKPGKVEEDDVALKAVYSKSGRVRRHSRDTIFVESDDPPRVVVINKMVLFGDGCPLGEKGDLSLAVGETVTFDAIPFESGSYQATCAWIGAKEPRLADRFNLREEEEPGDDEWCLQHTDAVVDGTVVVIPNHFVALVDVDSVGKVLLFRSCFPERCVRIQDEVAVGDTLRLSLRLGYIFSDRKQWFAARAWKHCVEVNTEHRSVLSAKEYLGLSAETDISRSEVTTSKIKEERGCAETATPSKVLLSTPPLSGVIRRLSADSACIAYETFNIYVDMRDVFVDSHLCTRTQFDYLVSCGKKRVLFEAVQWTKRIPREYISSMTHTAVRVWVGIKPSLRNICEALPESKPSLLDSGRTFFGVVSKFCLPKIALVYVEKEETTACLHVSMFNNKRDGTSTIADHIDLGQCVKFNLAVAYFNNNVLYASNLKLISEEEFKRAKEKWVKLSVAPKICGDAPATDKAPLVEEDAWLPYKHVHSPSKKRTLLLDCKGTLKFDNSTDVAVFKVLHDWGSSLDIHVPVVYGVNNDEPMPLETATRFNGCQIRFDAEFFMKSPLGDNFFAVNRMWESNTKRPPPERCLVSQLAYSGTATLLPTDIYLGRIKSIPLHDSAIAVVDKIPVLVTLDSLVTSEKINASYTTIDQYLKEGDVVRLKVEKGNQDGKYFKATRCGQCLGAEISERSTDVISWKTVWSAGEHSCTGRVKRDGKKYVVGYKSAKSPHVDLSLDIFAKGLFFEDGTLTSEEEVKDLEDREVTFYVAYSRRQEVADPPTLGLYIACAWLGQEPSPMAVLKDRLYESSESVCHNWLYEGVVKDFPLPTHMVCTIGPVPVVTPLTQSGNVAGIRKPYLTKGDIVTMRVQASPFANKRFLVSNEITPLVEHDEVFTFLKAKIHSLPKPVGIIKLENGYTVAYELIHLFTLAFEKSKRDETKVVAYLRDNKDLFEVGKEIYVTATKMNGRTATYRALKLWLP